MIKLSRFDVLKEVKQHHILDEFDECNGKYTAAYAIYFARETVAEYEFEAKAVTLSNSFFKRDYSKCT